MKELLLVLLLLAFLHSPGISGNLLISMPQKIELISLGKHYYAMREMLKPIIPLIFRKASFILGSELWEDKFGSLLRLVKGFISDVWELRKVRLYGD
ncbi:hypothetical protein GBAR_LOCUS6837, partial [Geodia barretti]